MLKIMVGLCLLLTAAAGVAQNYPVKPVRVITPFTAGSAIDTLARVLGQKMGDSWGQQVVIDNRIGANGIIGTEAAAKAPADGYTLYLGNISTLAINPHLYSKLPYDAVKDFAPITLAATIQVVLVVHPSLPVKSVKELIALAKARPGEINYASGGTGSAQHLPMEMLGVAAGIKLVHVPYKGLGPAYNDVIGGQVPMMWTGVSNVVQYLESGRLRVIAIGSTKRSPALPKVPTMIEAGVPGFDFEAWTGYLAPTGTPKELIAKLHADITRVLGTAEIRDKLTALGFDVVGNTPEQFATLIRNDIARFGKLVQAAGIKSSN